MADFIKKVRNVSAGIGFPVDNDRLATEITTFGLNHVYIDNFTGKVYIRNAINGLGDDWVTSDSEAVVSGETIKTATRELVNLEILSLPIQPVQLIAAPGPGKVNLVLTAFLQSTILNTINVDIGAALQLFYDGNIGIISSPFASVANILNASGGGQWFAQMAIPDMAPTPNTSTSITGGAFHALDQIRNKNICIADAFNGVNPYTDGDDANRLKVTVKYLTITL